MDNLVLLDNLSDTSNFILNILWEQDRAMLPAELLDCVNQRFSKNWGKKEMKQFLDVLVEKDYVTAKRRGLKVYYAPLSVEDVL